MLPFILELPPSHQNHICLVFWFDFGTIEVKSAKFRFGKHDPQVCRDTGDWVVSLSEAVELRVIAISFCGTFQNGLSKQRFSPNRNQPSRVELLRVKTPDSQIEGMNGFMSDFIEILNHEV